MSREQRLHIRGGGLKEKLFPKITDFGIENDHFYRKRAGQRSGSKPKPGGTGAQERVVRSSHARVDVPANDEGTGRRIVRPVSRTYGKGEQVPGSLSTSPVAEYVTQSPLQQRSARELSEAVGSNVLSNQSYQSGPIDGTTTNNRSSRAGTLPPPVPPKVPLSASVCILCDSQQAVVKAAAGAFCDECWTAAHQAAGSAPSATHIDNAAPDVANCASMSDNGDSDSPLDQITAENTRRNRHVHFEVPQSSSITRDLNVDENIKNPPIRANPNDRHQSGKLPQASEEQRQTLQGPEANVQALTTTTQEGRRKALSSQSRATADQAQNGLASISHRLDVAKEESSLDHGRSDSKDHLSANDRRSASTKQFSVKEPRRASKKKSAELKKTKSDNQQSAAKEISDTDKLMDAAKGDFCVKDVRSSVIEPKKMVEGDSSVSESWSAVSRPEHTTKKDSPVSESRSTANVSVPESHNTTKPAETDTSRTLKDPTSVHVRKCEAGLLLVCDYCSNLPATLNTDVGLFCDRCWDTAMQAEVDRGVLTKPADLGDYPSVRDPAAQERVRKDRGVTLVIDEARPEQPQHTSVEAAVERRTCRCRGQPATVEVSDVGTLCQNCLGHVAKAETAAEDRNAKGSATQKRTQSGHRLGSVVDVPIPESRPHETPTEVAAQHQPCKCAGRQATFLVDDVGSLCWKCLGLVSKTDEMSGNLSTSVSDLSKAGIGTDKRSPPSRVESEASNRPRGSGTLSSGEYTQKTEPVAQIRVHGQQELLNEESPRRESNGLPVLYLCKSCGKHPATELQEIRWVCLGCLGRETGNSTCHSSKSTAYFE